MEPYMVHHVNKICFKTVFSWEQSICCYSGFLSFCLLPKCVFHHLARLWGGSGPNSGCSRFSHPGAAACLWDSPWKAFPCASGRNSFEALRQQVALSVLACVYFRVNKSQLEKLIKIPLWMRGWPGPNALKVLWGNVRIRADGKEKHC